MSGTDSDTEEEIVRCALKSGEYPEEKIHRRHTQKKRLRDTVDPKATLYTDCEAQRSTNKTNTADWWCSFSQCSEMLRQICRCCNKWNNFHSRVNDVSCLPKHIYFVPLLLHLFLESPCIYRKDTTEETDAIKTTGMYLVLYLLFLSHLLNCLYSITQSPQLPTHCCFYFTCLPHSIYTVQQSVFPLSLPDCCTQFLVDSVWPICFSCLPQFWTIPKFQPFRIPLPCFCLLTQFRPCHPHHARFQQWMPSFLLNVFQKIYIVLLLITKITFQIVPYFSPHEYKM